MVRVCPSCLCVCYTLSLNYKGQNYKPVGILVSRRRAIGKSENSGKESHRFFGEDMIQYIIEKTGVIRDRKEREGMNNGCTIERNVET